MEDARHAKTEHYVANVPSDSYYRAQIRTLQDKLDKLQHEIDLKDAYIESLEASNKAMATKIDTLRNAALGMIEERYNRA